MANELSETERAIALKNLNELVELCGGNLSRAGSLAGIGPSPMCSFRGGKKMGQVSASRIKNALDIARRNTPSLRAVVNTNRPSEPSQQGQPTAAVMLGTVQSERDYLMIEVDKLMIRVKELDSIIAALSPLA